MATSSIIENIRVNNPRVLEEWVNAMEAEAQEPIKIRTEEERSSVLTDEAEIRAFMQKALARHGIQFSEKDGKRYLQYMKFL